MASVTSSVPPSVDALPAGASHAWPGKVANAGHLDLLGTPALVRLAHVRGGLDRRDELEDQVANTGDADDRGGDVAQNKVMQEDGADEDVD